MVLRDYRVVLLGRHVMGMYMQASTHLSDESKLSKSYVELDTLTLALVHVNHYKNIKRYMF